MEMKKVVNGKSYSIRKNSPAYKFFSIKNRIANITVGDICKVVIAGAAVLAFFMVLSIPGSIDSYFFNEVPR